MSSEKDQIESSVASDGSPESTGVSRIVDRMDHHQRYGSVEDIPVLVDAVKSLISYTYYLRRCVSSMELRLSALGEPNLDRTQDWFNPVIAEEFGVAIPSELSRRVPVAVASDGSPESTGTVALANILLRLPPDERKNLQQALRSHDPQTFDAVRQLLQRSLGPTPAI